MKTNVILIYLLFFGVSNVYGQYNPDRHNTSYNAGWISCESKESPNPVRGNSHWIMYDLGQSYSLGKIHIWNTNVPNFESIGIKEYLLDYSLDGTNWKSWGEAEVGLVEASGYYTGEEGPDLQGLKARYLLITAKSNHGGDCVGFSEIRIENEGLSTTVDINNVLEGIVFAQPSAFAEQTMFVIEGVEPGTYMYNVSDLLGRIIDRNQVNINTNKHEIIYNGSQLASGLYIFSLSDGKRLKSVKFEKIDP